LENKSKFPTHSIRKNVTKSHLPQQHRRHYNRTENSTWNPAIASSNNLTWEGEITYGTLEGETIT